MLLAFAGFSCSDKSAEEMAGIHLDFETRTLAKEDCAGEVCATIEFTWPVASGSEEADKINRAIQEELVSHLQNENEENDLNSLADSFLDSFIQYRTDFPDSPSSGWYISEQGEVTYQSDSTLSIRFFQSSYLGGAHGNSFVRYLNFDLATGEPLGPDELVLDRDALLALTEKKFREFHDVGDGVSLEADGRFFLDEGDFFLPNALGFKEGKFQATYVSYEIAPYAMGYTELEFTPEELNGIVRW